MRILFLCKKVPYPATDGESIVIMNDVDSLGRLGHQVFLFCLNTAKHRIDTKHYSEISFWDGFQSSDINPNSWNNVFDALFGKTPFQIARFHQSKVKTMILERILHWNIDIILYQGLAMTQYRFSEIPCLYRAHNVEHRIWKEMLLSKNVSIAQRIKGWIAGRGLKDYEDNLPKTIASIIVLSEEENHYFRSVTNIPSWKIPITINREYRTSYNAKSKGILFVGSLDWLPNQEGLNWFLENIFPKIETIPLTIAGKGFYQTKLPPNVQLVQDFTDIEELFAKHRLLIVPLLSGAGIRIKILESMKYGLPTLSTNKGAEGIVGDALVLKDSASDWIETIADLYSDEKMLLLYSKNLKQNFEDVYGRDIVDCQWQLILDSLIK